jgi:UDPglucose 6-dehydrogenase
MKVCVFGLWHLGSVIAAGLASLGHEIVGYDPSQLVVEQLSFGKAPLYEPGLDALLLDCTITKKLSFTNNRQNAARGAQVLWVAIDTPVDDDDIADINYVFSEIQTMLPLLEQGTIILVSSQLPVGSIKKLEEYSKFNFPTLNLIFASSPENLQLGKALNAFLHPDRIVVGVRSPQDRNTLNQLISTITKNIEWMTVESAEMTKHAINAFLATSVTFANEIAAICELVGADAKEVERGLKSEKRIGPRAYLAPGGPFAGGTLARDIIYLGIESSARNLSTPLLSSIKRSNDEHKNWVRRKLLEHFSRLKGVSIAVWGLTYKVGTDTLRRSLSVELCDWLLEQGAELHVYDPRVLDLPLRWANIVTQHSNPLDAIKNTKVLVVGTEWPEFVQFGSMIEASQTSSFVVIDANRHLKLINISPKLKYIVVGTPPEGSDIG